MAPFNSSFFVNPSRVSRWLQHIVFWLVLFGVRFYLTCVSFNVYNGFPPITLLLLTISSISGTILFYYVLVYYLWPKFFDTGGYIGGIARILLLILVYTILDAVAEKLLIRSCISCSNVLAQRQADYYHLIQSHLSNIVLVRLATFGTPFILLLTLTIPLSVKTALNAYRNHFKRMILESEKLQLELNFLRSQLNPHFLFNSLNNIYGLIIQEKNEQSASLVSRLSELLRYVLYDSQTYTMPIGKEIRLINDYIALEKVRLNYICVTFDFPANPAEIGIAPLLFIPLIENAFKFTPDRPGACIEAVLTIGPHEINFSIENTIHHGEAGYFPGGIGLTNLQKRLKLYYPGRYHYQISRKQNTYLAYLSVKL